MRTAAVPAQLLTGPFRLADAAAAGLTRRQLSSAPWRRLTRDVYAHQAVPDSAELRFAVAALVMPPGSAFSGATAAWLHGVDVRAGVDDPLEITAARGTTFRTRNGLLLPRQADLPAADLTVVRGLAVTTPLRTAFDLCRQKPRTEAVVALDALAHAGLVAPVDLAQYALLHHGWRGVLAVPDIVEQCEPLSESAMESRVRMLLIDAGLLRPCAQFVVMDETGFVARLDLAYPLYRLGIEFDGRVHEQTEVRVRDARRHNRLLRAGCTTLRFTGSDYYRDQGKGIVREVRAAIEAAGRGSAS